MGSETIMSSGEVVGKLMEMGFKKSDAEEAIEAVGLSVGDAVNYIVSGCCKGISKCSTRNRKGFRSAITSSSSGLHIRQSRILDHYRPNGRPSQCKDEPYISGLNTFASPVQENECGVSSVNYKPELHAMPCSEELDLLSDWEQRANILLKKHFGYRSLNFFQKEALSVWVAHQDCLVLAATGSGKSLCFQLPALLTGKVVVVISPLISLMHDQCLKLSKHGVSACFLGSGQPDNTVEKKAMEGVFSVIYVCPETIIRLIKPLQRLAESRGIALFAIDEVHCVSKWGHDFRPDYRRLSVLRENFSTRNLEFLRFDVPLMALTATATVRVREDVLNSLCMSNETKTVLTSFFRQNLKFSVKHSRTTSPSSYEKDFCNLIDVYARKRNHCQKKQMGVSGELHNQSASDLSSHSDSDDVEGSETDEDTAEVYSKKESSSRTSREKRMSVEYLENDVDIFQNVDDWDVACDEFCGQTIAKDWNLDDLPNMVDPPSKQKEVERLMEESLEPGTTIIYVPTRKETLSIAKYLCSFGVKAAAYNASLPKSHLRKVHKEFQENSLEVVVATIAFGMGIDKLNVRKIIHYGWPQSLEAYYQEAGRAGRDGKLAECVLYANLSHIPTLLPSRRSKDQMKQAYKMLSDCFRYGMSTSCCRAKMLVEYFGEDFSQEKCSVCDVCVNGPPEMQDCKEEAKILLHMTAACSEQSIIDGSYDDALCSEFRQRSMKKPNFRNLVCKIREQSQKFLASDLIWWRGLARIMEAKGYIRETDGKIHVQIKFPEVTRKGLEFIELETEQEFRVYPEADMLLSVRKCRAYSSFSEWGKGWADPEIRRQRLGNFRRPNRTPKKRKFKKFKTDSRTARGRIAAKIFKKR